jgi:hypothetical protein
VRNRSILSAVLSLAALSYNLPAFAGEPCTDCGKHTGADKNLIPKDFFKTDDGSSSNSLWGSSQPLQTGTQSTRLETGTQSTMLKTGTENTMLQTGTQSLMLQGGTERNIEDTNIEILIDCSQSMKEKLPGMDASRDPKMETAKRVLEQTMATIPADLNVGLRVFGQSWQNDPFMDCQQTALLVPIGTHNRRAIVEEVRQLKPYGLTPLGFALLQAAKDLQKKGGIKQIILISDGAESCGLDPCAVVRQITASGVKMKIDIVGLGLKDDPEAKLQLKCIANQTGGNFYDSNTTAELVDNLRKVAVPAVRGEVSGKVLTKVKSNELDKSIQDLLK